jgi:hypothetical protein
VQSKARFFSIKINTVTSKVMRMKRLVILFTLLWTVAWAQLTAVVTLGDSLSKPTETAIGGMNHGIFMNVLDYRDDFAQLNITSLRFPPGNIADEREMSELTARDFVLQWRLLGADKPVLVVANLFSGTAEQAAAAIQAFIKADIPLLGVSVGNEPDLYATNRGSPEWTPARYCEAFREYQTAIHAVDPSIRLAGPSVSGAPQAESYLAEVLELCGDVIDILTWHIYPTDGSAADEVALASSSQVSETIRRYRAWVSDQERNPLGYTRDIQLGITEFGLSWRTNNYRHLQDTIATLWLADALGQMLTEQLDMSHYFALQGTGGHGLIDNAAWRRPTYYLFELLRGFHGEVFTVQSSLLDLRAYAVRTPENLQLLLINRSAEDIAVRLELPELSQQATLQLLSDDTYEIYDDDVAYITALQNLNEPTLVPARALVLLTVPE